MRFFSCIRLVIAFEYGSLGNQLFQYAAIKSIAPNARLMLIGMDSLKNCFQTIDNFEKTITGKLILCALSMYGLDRVKLLGLAGNNKLFSLIREQSVGNRCIVKVEHGRYLPMVAVLDGFFQDERVLGDIKKQTIVLNQAALVDANNWLKFNCLASKHKYFVHIRRGDYLTWPSIEAPAVLPISWYQAQINRIRDSDNDALFIVFSNDLLYVKDNFSGQNDIVIAGGSEILDFNAMVLCESGGILSASTFSWWASYYSRLYNPDPHFIAPLHWAGWRKGHWFPNSIEASWLDYVEVPECGFYY